MDKESRTTRHEHGSSLPDGVEPVLCDFLLQFEADESEGRPRALPDYLARFPGFENEIAREYLARLDRTSTKAPPAPASARRYLAGELIGRGGMGEVRRVRDLELGRELAMKTLLAPGALARRRFRREAALTSKLDHPGIVPIHDIGSDENDQPFFLMRRVEGLDLEEVFVHVHRNEPPWTVARALEVLIKVCDTMAFAHSHGIVHRDLKPANVRVGRFGEVYVMDWGLARQIDEREEDGIDGDGVGDPPAMDALTLDGQVLGTPAYMAPEQAEGRNRAVGTAVDIHAVGALLYHLLGGRRPYSSGASQSSREVLELVRRGPPASLRSLTVRAPRELVAICEQAMQRDPARRYAQMEDLGRDLRAFLDRRLVSAYRASALERASKWCRRHASFVVPAVIVLALAALASLWVQRSRLEGRQRLVQLSRSQLVAAFDSLWPPAPSNRAAIERWVEQAQQVLLTRAEDQAALEALKRSALPMDPDAPLERAERARQSARARQRMSLVRYYAQLAEKIERGEEQPPDGRSPEWVRQQVIDNQVAYERIVAAVPVQLTFRFATEEDQVLFEALSELTSEQEKILGTARPYGLIDLARWGLLASQSVRELSLDRARAAWEDARRSIASREECPRYDGLELVPQLGLVPLGRDPHSGLWEFAHVASGEAPVRGADGQLVIDQQSALVFVLIPGGTLERGAQKEDPTASNFDPWSEPDSAPTGEVVLQPFFLSKYELTRAQWQRAAGRDPSLLVQGDPRWDTNPLHPVENVNFEDARRFLSVLGLTLPSEAQWEWCARAGTTTPWSCGADPAALAGHANLADLSGVRAGLVNASEVTLQPDFDDGFAVHAPIGSLLPNPFGLHDMMGNVREWCRDTGPFDYGVGFTHIETGERLFQDAGTRAVRGGSFMRSALRARSAARDQVGPALQDSDLGIRPARDLDF